MSLFSGLFGNPAAGQANNAYNQAFNTAGMLGAEGQGIGANLTPFLTQEMLHPQGFGQQGLSAQTAAATGGAGGALSAFQGAAAQRAGASRNAGAFQAGLDSASRNASKAAANTSEGIAANNADLQQNQQQQGAAGLGRLYQADTSGMLNAIGQEKGDIQTELAADAAPAPWMSQLNNGLALFGNVGKTVAGIPGMTGWGS